MFSKMINHAVIVSQVILKILTFYNFILESDQNFKITFIENFQFMIRCMVIVIDSNCEKSKEYT